MNYNYGSSSNAQTLLPGPATPMQSWPATKLLARKPARMHPGGKSQTRLNLQGVLFVLIVPWLYFYVIVTALSFSFHARNPASCNALILLCTLFLVAIGSYVVKGTMRKVKEVSGHFNMSGLVTILTGGEMQHQHVEGEIEDHHCEYSDGCPQKGPSWILFIFLSLLLAWISAVGCGEYIYGTYTSSYYHINDLGTHRNVNVAQSRGRQLLDAGGLVFENGSRIDFELAGSFRDNHVYCVAPVTIGNDTLANYDFWAVGKDCCTEGGRAWHCQGFDDEFGAVGGMRLMSDADRAFYRLAVQQANAAHGINSERPLMFSMTRDPPGVAQAIMDTGTALYWQSLFGYFCVQACLVATAVFSFSKARWPH